MSNLSERQKNQLQFLDDIYTISSRCSTRTYIWGGLVRDILEGRFLREHKDIDGFTLDLLDVKGDLEDMFHARGYTTEFRNDIDMLRIHKDGCEAAFNCLEFNQAAALWRHIGDEGTLYFPRLWLEEAPRHFYHTRAYISGPEFEYCIKARVELLSPIWQLRAQDTAALAYFTQRLKDNNADLEGVRRQVWSDNPYWRKRGYPEY